jgi:hypothetical protein
VFFRVSLLPAQSESIIDIDLNRSEFIKFQATIMEIDAARMKMVVAEKEIYTVDLTIEGYQLKTELRDMDGGPVPFESFHEGEPVYVEGIEFERDRVAASVIQHFESPQAAHRE